MEDLYKEETTHTPYIHFNSKNGIMVIKGRSIPDQPDLFWLPILNWFESYLLNPAKCTIIKIDLEYFNISSSKRILFLLYKLNELTDNGLEAKVEWHYRKTDEDMYEVGQDYAYMVRVPFIFKEYIDPNIATLV